MSYRLVTLQGLTALLVVTALPSAAVADRWIAVSNTAMSITGDLEIDDFEVVFENGKKLAFAELVADTFEVDGEEQGASVFRVAKPGNPLLLNGNRLCDGPVTYMASWGASQDADEAGVVLAAFEGRAVPTSSEEACALYTYEDQGGGPDEGIDPLADPDGEQ